MSRGKSRAVQRPVDAAAALGQRPQERVPPRIEQQRAERRGGRERPVARHRRGPQRRAQLAQGAQIFHGEDVVGLLQQRGGLRAGKPSDRLGIGQRFFAPDKRVERIGEPGRADDGKGALDAREIVLDAERQRVRAERGGDIHPRAREIRG